MRKLLVLLLAVFSFSLALAAPNLDAGKKIASTVCIACHGADGNSLNAIWPSLAGQSPRYLVAQMKAFKDGKLRNNPSMAPMMAPLSEQDMINVAAYYSSQKRVIGAANKVNLKRGELIYRGGDEKKHISACIACHGPKGLGNAQAGFPSLSGQHAAYILEELNDYKAGRRTTDINQIMQQIAKRMSQDDMKAVANYISGLH